jgi:hypothetical protein
MSDFLSDSGERRVAHPLGRDYTGFTDVSKFDLRKKLRSVRLGRSPQDVAAPADRSRSKQSLLPRCPISYEVLSYFLLKTMALQRIGEFTG